MNCRIEVGDVVTLNRVSKSWYLPQNARFKITEVGETDPISFLAICKDDDKKSISGEKVRYIIWNEDIKTIVKHKEKVAFS
jgi:hypothetical protein